MRVSKEVRLAFAGTIAAFTWAATACTGDIAGSGGGGSAAANGPPSVRGGARGTSTTANGGAGGTNGGGATGTPAACALPPPRVWKLTPTQIARSIASVAPAADFGTSDIEKQLASTVTSPAGSFRNDARWKDMSVPHVEQLVTIAENAARVISRNAPQLATCATKAPWTATCVQQIVETLGVRTFRRPLTAEELSRYLGFFDEHAAAGAEVALQQVAQALLLSPSFLYRSELGDGAATRDNRVALTAFERASALSYFVTDGPPDAALMNAARTGALTTKEQMAEHARRLLGAPRSPGLLQFFVEHFALEHTVGLQRDTKLFPRWSDDVGRDMQAETRTFLEHLLASEAPTVGTLLTAKHSYLNQRLAENYGITFAGVGDELAKTMLPAGRVGLFGQGTFLASHARPAETDIVRRGRFVREHVLCQPVPPPPPNIPAIPPGLDGKTTQRQRLANHIADPVCASCHAAMDSLGLAFENFDPVGAWRTTDSGLPIDASGSVDDVTASKSTFTNASELMTVLAEVPQTSACLSSRMYAYGHGRVPGDADACSIDAITARFRSGGGDFKELVVAIVTSDDFLHRAN